MGTTTKIEWTDHTFNPWIGCQKVSPGCDNCYAETLMDHRYHKVEWGPHGERLRTSVANWQLPIRWNKEAARLGIRPRVFCASLADWLDNRVPKQWRSDLGQLIVDTPNLDWLLLTKRPENYEKIGPWVQGNEPPNVMFGVTVESAEYRKRIWKMLTSVGAHCRVFVSYEPAMGALGLLTDIWKPGDTPRLAWLICGGESGPGARPMHPDWARDARDQCRLLGISFFFKQWGEWHADALLYKEAVGPGGSCPPPSMKIGKKKAGALLDGREWREFPI